MAGLGHRLSTSSLLDPTIRIQNIMSRKKIQIFLTTFLVFLNSVIHISSSQAIGSGVCTSTTNSSTGVVVANSGGFCYVAFTALGSNSWTAPIGVTAADFLIIAGGGAGGAGAWGGGGGAGEVVSYTNYSVSSSSATSLSVGDGGASGTASVTASANRSNSGQNSWIGSASGVVANGGGAGASYAWNDLATYSTGANGGSGGGGTENAASSSPSINNLGGTSTKTTSGSRTGYGNNGGRGGNGSTQAGGGGGGAGGVGSDAGTTIGGNGGAGTNLFSTWLSAISSGMSGVTDWQTATNTGFIAGGGGGGTTTTAGSAGSGGAGAGGSNTTQFPGYNAVSNTGSGGGGAGYGSAARSGGKGGSGLIIIKYAVVTPSVNSFNLTGNATTATFRSPTTINLNINIPARVTFRAKGVVITGCKNKLASGSGSSFAASCSWKPSVRGQINLTADISPTGPWASATSSPLSIRVANRSGTRT